LLGSTDFAGFDRFRWLHFDEGRHRRNSTACSSTIPTILKAV
jgi:hypothetical protein